ncbi:MAG: N-acetyltransferase [Myxococcota bacterium]
MTGPAVSIRVARLSDASAMIGLHRSILEEDRYFITSADEFADSVERRQMLIRNLLQQHNSHALVAIRDRLLVGMLYLRGGTLHRMRHVSKLEIFVDRNVRGQGVGRALMMAGLQWATDSPLVRKVGLTVFTDNTRAIGLYRSLGFEVEGERIGEYCEEDGTLRSDLMMYRWCEPG